MNRNQFNNNFCRSHRLEFQTLNNQKVAKKELFIITFSELMQHINGKYRATIAVRVKYYASLLVHQQMQ
jgi:hypothetical protein